MTFVRAIDWLRASLLALFVVAQVAGVIRLIYDHTLNVFEATPVMGHGWRQELSTSSTIAQCLKLEHEIHDTASMLCILGFEPLK